jgi:hypothetical protein
MPFQVPDIHIDGTPDEAAAIAGRSYPPTGGYRISVRWTPRSPTWTDTADRRPAPVDADLVRGIGDDPQFGIHLSLMIN